MKTNASNIGSVIAGGCTVGY